jgi:hypothetical protein
MTSPVNDRAELTERIRGAISARGPEAASPLRGLPPHHHGIDEQNGKRKPRACCRSHGGAAIAGQDVALREQHPMIIDSNPSRSSPKDLIRRSSEWVWPDFLARLSAGMETIRSPGSRGRRPRAGQPPNPPNRSHLRTAPRQEGPRNPRRPPLSRRTTAPSCGPGPAMIGTNHPFLPDRQPAAHDLEKISEFLRTSSVKTWDEKPGHFSGGALVFL